MKKLVKMVVLFGVWCSLVSSAHGLTLTGSGLGVNESKEISDGVEFTGLAGYVGFDFEEHDNYITLTLVNTKSAIGLMWLNYGNYKFSGFENITDMYILSNNKYYGKVINNFKYDDSSITLDFSIGGFGLSCSRDQELVFYIETETTPIAPVPEPATSMLMMGGLLSLVGRFRRK